MSKLNQLIGVGFCKSYGDGDFAVNGAVCNLSRERFNELKLATLSALRCAEDMWLREQADKHPAAAGLIRD